MERVPRAFGGRDAGHLAGLVDRRVRAGTDVERSSAGNCVAQTGEFEAAILRGAHSSRTDVAVGCVSDCSRRFSIGRVSDGKQRACQRTQALATNVSGDARRAILDASYSWKLTAWAGMALTLAGSVGGIFLA